METNGQEPRSISQTGDTVVQAPMVSLAALDWNAFQNQVAMEVVPASWEDRARKAWEYYTTVSVVADVVNTWLDFAVGEDVEFSCDDEAVQEEAQQAYWELGLDSWVRDMLMQLLVKGDCLGYYRLDEKGASIIEVLCVNPVTVKLEYVDGELLSAKQTRETTSGIGLGEEITLPVEQVLHRKWNAPGYALRGNSMILPAFEPIEQLRDYRKADRAIAKRWTTPLRFIKIGGKFGDKLIMPDQKMISEARDTINKMDIRSGLVVPFWVTAETFGTEGHVLSTEEKIREIKEDIMVALGLSRALVTGDGPNFATAQVSLKKMLIRVRRLRQIAKDLLYWVFDKWLELRGWQGKQLEFVFPDLNLDEQAEGKKLLLEMYDRGLVSKKTVQVMMELNPEIEDANRGETRLTDKSWSVADVLQMVQLGILPVGMAQGFLGIDPAKAAEQAGAETVADIERLYTRANSNPFGKLCDDCLHFDEERNHCGVQRLETTFDTPACVLFDPKISIAESDSSLVTHRQTPSANAGSSPQGKPGGGGCGCFGQ